MTKALPHQVSALAERFECHMRFAGKSTADVPELAGFRRRYRRMFYRWANVFFGLSIFNWIAANNTTGALHLLHVVGFTTAFTTMFLMEFRARLMTRQLKRSAAEQLARDLLGIHN